MGCSSSMLGLHATPFFCWGSTISSLGVVLPGADDNVPKTAQAPKGQRRVFRFSLLTLLSAAFVTCFGVGLSYSCMSLRLDFQPLIDNGKISKEMVPILVDTYHLPDLAHADVTIPRCIERIVQDILSKFEFNGVLAVIMMAMFVIGFAILGMGAVLLSAVQFHLESERWCRTLRLAKQLKKLAMLDVTILGVCVVVASGSVYKSEGLILALQPGILGLIGAQISYEITYLLVTCWCQRDPPVKKVEHDLEKADPSTEVVDSVVPGTAGVADSMGSNLENNSSATQPRQEEVSVTREGAQNSEDCMLEDCNYKASL